MGYDWACSTCQNNIGTKLKDWGEVGQTYNNIRKLHVNKCLANSSGTVCTFYNDNNKLHEIGGCSNYKQKLKESVQTTLFDFI